jgi:hypothetical protein
MPETVEIFRKSISVGVFTLELAIWYDPLKQQILKVEYITEKE